MFSRLVAALGIVLVCATASPLLPQQPDTVEITFTRPLMDFLATLQLELPAEIFGCLELVNEREIGGVHPVELSDRSTMQVRHEWCMHGEGSNVIGEFHTHLPTKACEFSEPDRKTFEQSKLPVSLLLCGFGQAKYLLRGDTTAHVLPGFFGFARK